MHPSLSIAQKALVLNSTKDSILTIKYHSSISQKVVGKLGVPGGRMEFGEQPDEAIIREVQEETGITITPLLPFYIWTWEYSKHNSPHQIVAVARLAKYRSGQIKEPEYDKDHESRLQTAQWIKLSDLQMSSFIDDEQPFLQKFLEYQQYNPFLITNL